MRFISHAADLPTPTEFDWIANGLAFGGDYNPEQWPEEVWLEDMALMREAGVTTVSLGVFAWGLLEVADGVFEWDWLDRVMDLLAEHGIGAALATPTAAPPMWLMLAHPEIAPVTAEGVRHAPGGRLGWHPSSAVFRRFALRVVRAIAERYRDHPALRLWHVSNELGNENARSYDDETAEAWRRWLAERYGDIDAVNAAWGTAFWGHRYTGFEQVLPPRFSSTGANPGLLLDFERFTSDALLAHYEAERAVLREVTPTIPITTNFMVQREPGVADYARWAREVDLVANDHYTVGADPRRHAELAFSADRVRGMAGGRPWLLIEHAAAAVNWQRVNRAKTPGELRRNSLAHIARGADGAMFFQWRQSTAGAEQHHSAMLPHAGADSTIFRDVVRLGADLAALAPIRGTVVPTARVAILFDHDSAAALRSGRKPTELLTILDLPHAVHRLLTERGIAVDVLPGDAELDDYAVVVVPTQLLAPAGLAERLAAVVDRGGHVVVSFASGLVDETNRVIPGGYPGAFLALLGIRADEILPLLEGERLAIAPSGTASIWSERVELVDAEAVATIADGPLAGRPAATRRRVGDGTATYLAVRADDETHGALLADVLALAGIEPIADAEPGLEVVRRVGESGRFLFAINHADAPRAVRASGVDLLTGQRHDGTVSVPAGAVVVIEESA